MSKSDTTRAGTKALYGFDPLSFLGLLFEVPDEVRSRGFDTRRASLAIPTR